MPGDDAAPHPEAGSDPGLAATAELEQSRLLEVTVEGATERRPARLFLSPQGYAIYVLPQIEMTAEEPGRDQAFARVDGDFFVRIERLAPAAALDELRQNARLWLQNIGDVHRLQGAEIGDAFFRDAEFFLHASNARVSANVIVMEIDSSLFRLTMHIPNREAAEGITPSFWAMLRTIRPVAELGMDGHPAAARAYPAADTRLRLAERSRYAFRWAASSMASSPAP